jgi:hypothetical protein
MTQALQCRAMGDREQPRAQGANIAAPSERTPGIDKRLLHHVLGVISDETATVAQQQWPISVGDGFKGGVLPGPCKRDQIPVGLFPLKPQRSGRTGRESAARLGLAAPVCASCCLETSVQLWRMWLTHSQGHSISHT